MKLLTTLSAIMLLSFGAFAQTEDSLSIDVVYAQTTQNQDFAFMINGDFIASLAVQTLVPSGIESVNVIKDTVVDGRTYKAVLWMTLKEEYTPIFISLNELKQKYTSLKSGPTVFMIDDRLITSGYENLMVDEKYILKIEVNTLSETEDQPDINVVKLLTRSEENIRKSKEIRIRGNASFIAPTPNYSDDFRSIDRQMGIR
ncbi:MAG TPA: hypothetical protein VNQ80_07920 [Parapedobacter sp.]|uniref:hypothetical protein n=1 Tax=Parapedobacter sp. TaxID=1958893 RepID=UPI002B9210FD|nr:hypothetical protein [Parapedobacter sp.]HWK57247.1 hypothetical protein [Parapedobacter sp.]